MELAMMGPPAPAPQAPPAPPNDEGGAAAAGAAGAEAPEALWVRQQRAKNWFSAENALRVYNLVSGWGLGAGLFGHGVGVWWGAFVIVVVVGDFGFCWFLIDPILIRLSIDLHAHLYSTWTWTRTTTASSASGSCSTTVRTDIQHACTQQRRHALISSLPPLIHHLSTPNAQAGPSRTCA